MIDLPTAVEVEFAPGVWTDLGSRLLSAKTKRGKQRAFDKVGVGTMVVTLKNDDRMLDPENAAGLYYGALDAGLAIRLRVTGPGRSAVTSFTLQTGSWGVDTVSSQNYQYYKAADAATEQDFVTELGTADVTFDVDVYGSGSSGGPTARYVDALNLWHVQARVGAGLDLVRVKAGVRTTVATKSMALASGSRITLRCVGNDIRVSVNGVVELTWTASAGDPVGTMWGLHDFNIGALGTRFENPWATYTRVHDVFTGVIDRIVQTYPGPNSSRAIFHCSDGVAKLAGATLKTPWETTLQTFQPKPRMWMRLNERAGPNTFDRSGNGHHGTLYGDPAFGVTGTINKDPDPGIKFDASADNLLLGPGALPTVPPWTIRFGLQVPSGSGTQYLLSDYFWPRGLIVWKNPDGTVSAQTDGSAVKTNAMLVDNLYNLNIIAEPGQRLKIYVGGSDYTDYTLTSGKYLGTNHTLPETYYIFGPRWFPMPAPFTGAAYIVIDEIVTWDYALTTADQQRVNDAASGWNNDSIQTRINRILDAVGWPTAKRAVSVNGDEPLSATALSTTALEHLRALENTMEGRLLIQKNGTIQFLERNTLITGGYATSQGTFGDGPGELGYAELGNYTRDWDLVTNLVRRRRYDDRGTGGGGVTETVVVDQASVTKHGLRDQTAVADVESLYRNPTVEYDLAAWRLAHYSKPIPHIDTLMVRPSAAPDDLWPQVLGRELGERITVTRRPQGVGAPMTAEVIIEGIEHDIGPKRWVTVFSIDAIAAQRYFRFDYTLWDSEGWRFSV